MAISDEIEKLRLDARFGKSKHFSAADRVRRYHYWLGLPVIAISIFLGSVFFSEFLQAEFQKIIGAFLAFLSALLVALQTFLNPYEREKGHRSIGDRYLEISRNCRLLSAKLVDQLVTVEDACGQYEALLAAYNATNIEAQSFPVNKKDFKAAQKQAETKVT